MAADRLLKLIGSLSATSDQGAPWARPGREPATGANYMRKSIFAGVAAIVVVLGLAGHAAFAAPDEKAAPKPWYDKITVKGYLQLDAIFPQGNAVAGSYSNFRIRRARPTISAVLDPMTKIQVQVDAGSGKAGSGQSTVVVTDTFGERTLPGLGLVRFGQYLIPFGSEVYEDNAALRCPLELSYAAESVALAERDIGVTVQSSANPASGTHWALSFLNGQGFRSADSNPNKTWAGRIAHDFGPSVRLGASGIIGSYTAADKKDYDRHVLGAEMHVRVPGVGRVAGEFYNVRFIDSTTSSTPSQVRYNGGYLLVEGDLPSCSSTPFVRYQRTYGGLDYRSVDVGWRYQYAPNQRLTAEYDFVAGRQRDSMGVRWQLGF